MKLEVIDRDTAWAEVIIDSHCKGGERITRAELEACLREMDEAGRIEVGDFVEVVAWDRMSAHQKDRVGQLGKVLAVGEAGSPATPVGVEFTKYSSLSHDLVGRTKRGHGLWFHAEMLRMVK